MKLTDLEKTRTIKIFESATQYKVDTGNQKYAPFQNRSQAFNYACGYKAALHDQGFTKVIIESPPTIGGNTMKIERVGTGFALYGHNPDTGKWFGRWYSSEAQAIKFCVKRSWEYDLGRPQPLKRD